MLTGININPMLAGFLYLIHCDTKRAHAQHYLGSSYDLMERLTRHANGRGAAITKALWEDAQAWQLAALYTIRPGQPGTIRELEKRAKMRHFSIDYCPICKKGDHTAPPGLIQYPLPPNLTSHQLRTN